MAAMARNIRTGMGALEEQLGEMLVTQAIHHNQAMYQQKVLIKAGYRAHIQAMLHERFIGGLVDGPANPVAAPVPPPTSSSPINSGRNKGNKIKRGQSARSRPDPPQPIPLLRSLRQEGLPGGEGWGNSLRATTQRRERDAAPHHKGKKALENSF